MGDKNFKQWSESTLSTLPHTLLVINTHDYSIEFSNSEHYPPGSSVKDIDIRCIHGETDDVAERLIEQVKETKEAMQIHSVYSDKDGMPGDSIIKILPLQGKDRPIAKIACWMMQPPNDLNMNSTQDDPSTSPRTGADLELSFRKIFDSIQDGVVVIDQHMTMVRVNEPMQRMLSHLGTLEGNPCYKMIRHKKQICEDCPGQYAFKTGKVHTKIVSCPENQSPPRYYQLSYFPVLGANGKSRYLVKQVRDITRQIQSEDILKKTQQSLEQRVKERTLALQQSRDRLEQTLESINDGIFVLDRDWVYTYANSNTLKLLNKTQQELLGHCIWDVFPGAVGHPMYHACHQVIKTGQAQRFESHCKEMGMWFSGTVSPDPDGVSVYLQDVTQEKMAQQKLLKQQEKLRSLALSLSVTEEQARRKIADVLHDDIGQSLISCKMMLETWEQMNPNKNKEATINTVCNALESLIQKTHDLTFDLSYPTLFKFGLITAIKEWIDNEIKAKHGLAVHIKDGGIPEGMDDKMEAFTFRAIKEIVFNVVKHAHAQQLHLQLDDVDPFIHVMAKDDGVGFDYDIMQHSDRRLGGFGLFSIQERLEYLGGTFRITSKSGCGTQVNMKIPKTMPI